MISTAKNNLQKGMGNIFLLWGYLVAGISLGTLILLLSLPAEIRYYSYYIWFLMIFGYPIHYYLVKKMSRLNLALTYVDKTMNWVWIAFSISILIVVGGILVTTLLVIPGLTEVEPGREFLRWFPWLFFTPFLLCIYGFALFVSGKAYRFKPFVTGGFICWAGTLLLLLSIHHLHVAYIQQAVLCISALSGFVIPGHLLNRKEGNHVSAA
jgi:hypothetical protein